MSRRGACGGGQGGNDNGHATATLVQLLLPPWYRLLLPPWYSPSLRTSNEMMLGRPVTARAILMALSTASAPLLQ